MKKIKEYIKRKTALYKLLHGIWIGVNQVPVKIGGEFRAKGFFLNENDKKLLRFKDCHKGERCFLIANGPSLTIEDLNLIKNEWTFGCNKIFYLFDKTEWRPSYYCILDEDYIARYQDEIFPHLDFPIFTNNVIARRISKKNKDGKNIIYSKQIIYTEFQAWTDLMRYTYATKQGTIMSFVMAVALYMGFSEIYILGMDNSSTTAGNHFSGYKEDPSLRENLERRIKENGWNANHWRNQTEFEMNKFKEYAQQNNIKIFNATRGGKLEVFARVNLDDCF